MAISIHLLASAFSAGGPLADLADYPQKARIIVGNKGNKGSDLLWALNVAQQQQPVGSLVVSLNDSVLDDIQLSRCSQSIRNQLADYVTKGIMEVLQDGVALVASQIQSFSETPIPVQEVIPAIQIDGFNQVMTLTRGYVLNTVKVWVNSLLMHPGTGYAIDWSETSPSGGTLTASAPPAGGAQIVVEYIPSV